MTKKFSFIESIHSTLSCQQWRKHYFLAKNDRSLETKAGYRLISIPQSEFIRAVAQPGSALPWGGRSRVGPLRTCPCPLVPLHRPRPLRFPLRGLGIGCCAPAQWPPYTPRPLRDPLRGLWLGCLRTRAMAPSDLPPPIQVSRSAVGWFAACAEGVPPAAPLLANSRRR
jgi:hypothetical protein